MDKKNNREILLSGSMVKAIMMLTIPVMINSFLQTMYNLTDTYWLGKLGTEELAAINLVTPMQNIVIQFGSGITVAGSVLISQYLGAKRDEDAKSMANQIFACAIIFSLVCVTACVLATPAIVTWLGATGETWSCGKTYLQFVIIDMPFLYTVNIYAAIRQAQGDTVRPMFLNLGGIIINMILDPLLMVVFQMGVMGAALATVAAKAIPAVIAFILLNNKKDDVYLNLSKLKFEKEKIKNILVV
ncbi:MAG: polysaccharide biosynthesis C-terminal domain-containing protein, partial [Lachnospiraceae bacterium]|nr:polysaccharide biosynthesis C-terminal domain-containing protein [Lachnospiraceae bacterium]